MLEHVGDAGGAGGIVDGAGVHVGVEGDHGRFMPLDDDEVQAVGEREFCNFFLKFLQALGGGEQREEKEKIAVCLHGSIFKVSRWE